MQGQEAPSRRPESERPRQGAAHQLDEFQRPVDLDRRVQRQLAESGAHLKSFRAPCDETLRVLQAVGHDGFVERNPPVPGSFEQAARIGVGKEFDNVT